MNSEHMSTAREPAELLYFVAILLAAVRKLTPPLVNCLLYFSCSLHVSGF
jgi:hypothetical protein